MRRTWVKTATAVAVLLIVGMTLTAESPWLYQRIADALYPEVSRLTVARVLNVVLFVPIGVAIGLWRRPWWLLAAVTGSVAIELTQHLLPDRNPDVYDVVTNTAGAALGYLVVAGWRAAARRRRAAARRRRTDVPPPEVTTPRADVRGP